MRLCWLTDLHLNHLPLEQAERFLLEVRDQAADAVLLTGDIAEHPESEVFLSRMAEVIGRPIYFVLGNHDYYFSSIAATRAIIADLCRRHPQLHYLTSSPPVVAADDLTIVGHDGWSDGRAGDFLRSLIFMNDYQFIEELAGHDKLRRLSVLNRLGDEAALAAARSLEQAIPSAKRIWFLTHAPPFRQACLYQGQVSNDEWAPHFVCEALGAVLLQKSKEHPDCEFTVLCGHTHSPGVVPITDNLQVLVGGAEYGKPEIQRIFEV